jgi:hypothetical protein
LSSENPASAGESHAWGRALSEYLSTESEKLGGPSTGAGVVHSGSFDETALFDEPSEILLMEADAHESLYDALKLEQCEGSG